MVFGGSAQSVTQAEKTTKDLLLQYLNVGWGFGADSEVEVKGKKYEPAMNQKGQIVLRPIDGEGKVIRIHITLTEMSPIRRGKDPFKLL